MMTGLEALQSVQYVTVHEKRFAVVDINAWESLLEWLETLEDTRIVQDSYRQLAEANGDRERAGWLKWDAFKEKESEKQ